MAPTSLANSLVALVAVLGSGNVEILAIPILSILGMTVIQAAKVSSLTIMKYIMY